LETAANLVEVGLDDSLWNNRKALKKNLTQTNLTSIIELHKSNKWADSYQTVTYEKNEYFEQNLNKVNLFKSVFYCLFTLIFLIFKIKMKIESTPAYLLPKVGTFCYDLLKSMLHKIDDTNTNNQINNNNNNNKMKNTANLNKQKNNEDSDEKETESESNDDEDMQLDLDEEKLSNQIIKKTNNHFSPELKKNQILV
jgi:hypothetical protein